MPKIMLPIQVYLRIPCQPKHIRRVIELLAARPHIHREHAYPRLCKSYLR